MSFGKYIFQQDSVLAHRARASRHGWAVVLGNFRLIPSNVWPPNSSIIVCGAFCSSKCIKHVSQAWRSWSRDCWPSGHCQTTPSLQLLFSSGVTI